MRIQTTDRREQIWDDLEDATGESTTSGALDAAAKHYLKMAGDTVSQPTGQFETLLRTARDEGSLTAEEIADILNTDELPVKAELEVRINED